MTVVAAPVRCALNTASDWPEGDDRTEDLVREVLARAYPSARIQVATGVHSRTVICAADEDEVRQTVRQVCADAWDAACAEG